MRTYIDACILIAAFQGKKTISERALKLLDDPKRNLVVSDFLRLEVLPKPIYHKRQEEIEFMKLVLDNAENLKTTENMALAAIKLASKYDLAPIDALHIGAAFVGKVDEFVTLEKQDKPLCKVKEIKVISLHSERS